MYTESSVKCCGQFPAVALPVVVVCFIPLGVMLWCSAIQHHTSQVGCVSVTTQKYCELCISAVSEDKVRFTVSMETK